MSQGNDPNDSFMTDLRISGMSPVDNSTIRSWSGSPSSVSDKKALASGLWPHTQPGTADNTTSVTAASSSSLGANEHKLHPKTTDVVPVKTGDDQQGQCSTDTNVSNAPEFTFELVLSAIPNSVIDVSYGTAQAAKMVRTFQHPVPPLPVSAI
ncbi:uncharacterized protein FRV6_15045 [Fusarium oxysporum]|uniref:Uncharacterized protein n=1 Tax=Fusarium oxysporum TaxID=5507 RepID=A0A2H3TQQ7_FUSOX|nr:uncharacterized protein FRV6_15045 [Fusarium oxysporum]